MYINIVIDVEERKNVTWSYSHHMIHFRKLTSFKFDNCYDTDALMLIFIVSMLAILYMFALISLYILLSYFLMREDKSHTSANLNKTAT